MSSLKEIVNYIDDLLQPYLFQDYCPNGLQVEGRSNVNKIVAGVTACQALIDEAIKANADALLVHHGYFWKGEDACIVGMKRSRILALLENNISLISYHLPLDAHPVYGNNVSLANQLDIKVDGPINQNSQPGIVFTGQLAKPLSGNDFNQLISKRLKRDALYIPGPTKHIQTIAWCTGGAQSYIEQAVAKGVDAYLTGEVSEQTVHIARENNIHFYAAGHHATERYGVQSLGQHLADEFAINYQFIDIDNPA